MKHRRIFAGLLTAVFLSAVAAFQTGCEGDSAETAIRNVALIIAGVYSGSLDGGKLVSNNSGSQISSIDLRQDGDQIEGVDNNGVIFKGTLGQVGDTSASFTLRGRTTAGADGTIVGTIDVSGTVADMVGTWAEPSLFGTVRGSATVPEPTDPDNGGDGGDGGNGDVTITGNPPALTLNVPETFTASGSGTLTWTDSPDLGGFSSNTGASVQYTPDSTGTVTISVSNGTDSDSVTLDIGL